MSSVEQFAEPVQTQRRQRRLEKYGLGSSPKGAEWESSGHRPEKNNRNLHSSPERAR
jgi:hypothetical protein